MPRETIWVTLSTSVSLEPVAIFLSKLAYPDPVDEDASVEFMMSLCRWMTIYGCEVDPGWAATPQLLRPAAFLEPEREWRKAFNRGANKLRHRFIAAGYIVLPHMMALAGIKQRVEGYTVTVQHMSQLAMEYMRWEGDSTATIKSRIWGPTRPVAHAALSVVMWVLENRELLKTDEGRRKAFLLASHPKTLKRILIKSEKFRLKLPLVPQFRIKEEDTIQFLPEE